MRLTPTDYPNLYLHQNGTYYFVKNGIERSLRTKEKKESLRRIKLHEVRYDEYKSGTYNLTVNHLSVPFLEYRLLESQGKIKGKKQIRVSTYNEAVDIMNNHILPFFGKTRISEVDALKWEDYRAFAKVKDISNQKKVLNTFLKWCAKRGYIKSLPLLDLDKPDRRPRRILTPNEISLILPNIKGNLRVFILMALGLGMRRSEIMKLSWDRVDLELCTIVLLKKDVKRGEGREIPFDPTLAELLRERKGSQSGKTKWVFPNARDSRRHADVSGLKTAWATCLRRSFNVKKGNEPDITWHDLRATREYYAHKRADLSRTQLEKFFGANVEIQRKTYVKFKADDVRDVLNDKLFQALIEGSGKTPENSHD